MYKYGKVLITLAAAFALVGCGVIETGNVGVRTTFGKINPNVEMPGFYTSFVSSVDEAVAKEITVDLDGLTPKAADNLSLDALDISISYVPNPLGVAEFMSTYKGQSAVDAGLVYPGFVMIQTLGTSTTLGEVAKMDSLTIHTKRNVLEAAILAELQTELDSLVPGKFKVTRVVARTIDTDDTIEDSIRKVVQNQKELEAMAVQEQIAAKQAQIEITKAHGIAQANQIINGSLTREYLQHEANLTLQKFAESGNASTVVVPAGMNITPLMNVGK